MGDAANRLISYVAAISTNTKIAFVLLFLFILFFFFKLARSSTLNESGKVVVRYHSPLQWPRRYAEQLAQSRSTYSPKQKKVLSFLYRGKSVFEAFGCFLLGSILVGAGILLVTNDSLASQQFFPWILVGSGCFFLVAAVWVYRSRSFNDPFIDADKKLSELPADDNVTSKKS